MTDLSYLHNKLNEAQQQALQQLTGVVIINAGPGTGKTKTLTARIAYLIKEQRVPAQAVLALTFTQKAAAEMKERLIQLLNTTKLPLISTFHSFAYNLLQQEKKNLTLITHEERDEVLKEAAASLTKKMTVRDVSLLISRYKSSLEEDKPEPVRVYDSHLSARGLMDFDDMLLFFLNLLKQDSLLREKVQLRYQYIHVDEFQDTNTIQYRILQHIIPPQNNLFVIGDPLQSIYSFRGANVRIFETIRQNISVKPIEIRLSTNYRSGKNVIAASSALFPEAPISASATQEPGNVSLIETFNEFTEADWIVNEICSHMGGIDLNQAGDTTGFRFSDFAVIYRTHALARILEQRFSDSAIPYQVIGSNSLYEQKEVKFIIAWLFYLHSHESRYLEDIKKRAPQPFTADLQEALKKDSNHVPVSALVQKVVDLFHLKDMLIDKPTKLRNLNQFMGSMVQFDNYADSLAKAVAYLTYLKEHEYFDPQGDKVTLMTIHAAKGLEFAHVFICGLEDGIIPLRRKQEETDLEEEKRLLYVAMTRAKQRLYLLKARHRNKQKTTMSSFEVYLPEAMVQRVTDPVIDKIAKKAKRTEDKKSQMSLL